MNAAERGRLIPALWDVRSFLLSQGEGGRAQAVEDTARRLEEDAAAAEAAVKVPPKAAAGVPAAGSGVPSAVPAKG